MRIAVGSRLGDWAASIRLIELVFHLQLAGDDDAGGFLVELDALRVVSVGLALA